jgi:hypothetical protein
MRLSCLPEVHHIERWVDANRGANVRRRMVPEAVVKSWRNLINVG